MTIKNIDKFREELEQTEFIDDRSEYFKLQAIQYLKLYCDCVEDKGKRWIKKKESGLHQEENR